MFITSTNLSAAQSPYLQTIDSVKLVAFHRMFTNYTEAVTALPEKPFSIGDEDFSGKVTDFCPDFQIDSTGHVYSRSDTLGNPAAKVVVFKEDKAVDSSWAFIGEGPPHFSRSSMFGFRIEAVFLKTDSTHVEDKGE
jgi:hypothetical protein